MLNKIYINSKNMIYNANYVKSIAGKKICLMIKANAYGHGIKETVCIVKDIVDCFGVSNMTEALEARKYCDNEIIVFGVCEDYKLCMENNISFALFSYNEGKKIIDIADKFDLKPSFHLCLNSGMNRYGFKTEKEFEKILKLLIKNDTPLKGFYTHLSSITTDENYTKKQIDLFNKYKNLLPKLWNVTTHIGGGKSIFMNTDCDMCRVGIEIYGYEIENVKPVLTVQTKIVSCQKAQKGEHVGYLCSYTCSKSIKTATIPVGYGDGFPRKLSNVFNVEIGGRKFRNIGNICMDAMMIDIDSVKVDINDDVILIKNATEIANILDTTVYEVLTNLNNFRGERIII